MVPVAYILCMGEYVFDEVVVAYLRWPDGSDEHGTVAGNPVYTS